MASNINIQKKCEWCGKLFIAHKISTRCCSRRCANLAYKGNAPQFHKRCYWELNYMLISHHKFYYWMEH